MQTLIMKYSFYLSLIISALAFLISVMSSESHKLRSALYQCDLQLFYTEESFFDCHKDPTEEKLKELKNSLTLDEALVTIHRKQIDIKHVEVYAQTDVCHECPCINITKIQSGSNVTCKIDTAFAVQFVAVDADNPSERICSTHRQLVEYGWYELWVEDTPDNETECNVVTNEQPGDPYIPIYVAMGICAVLSVLYGLISQLYRKGYLYRVAICFPYERLINSDLGTPTAVVPPEDASHESEDSNPRPPPKRRLRSLDTFRGFSLVVMIFVNYKGGGYWFFHHSAWDGLTVADLVFPWFTFIMGTSIALAFRSLVLRGTSKPDMIWKVVKRTGILFTLGLLISNGGPKGTVELNSLRIPGVLQRLALTYFAVALMQVFFADRGHPVLGAQTSFRRVLQDLLPYWPEWIISIAILTVHICLTFLLKIPHCPTGYIGPGGLHKFPRFENCTTGGAAGYIDKVVLGESHIYQHPTCTVPYQTSEPYDPEGILGTLTSIFICFLGLQAGKIIVVFQSHTHRILRWIIWSVITGLIAGVLCNFSQHGGVIPLNKNMWSVSFVLALSSMAFVLLVLCYVLIDVCNIWSGAPFVYPGMNSIVIYMCHEVLQPYFPIQWTVPQTHAAQLAMNLYGAALWTTVAGVLYYKQVFIAI